jgi:hypothetical protein
MSKFRYSAMALVALYALVYATSGQAQATGTYTGSAADGSPLSFTVGKDGGGKLAVTSLSFNFTAKCNGTTPSSFHTGWGFSSDAVIFNKKASLVYGKGGGTYFYHAMTFDFSKSPVSGNELTRTGILVTSNSIPGAAEFCVSSVQAFTATLNPSAAAEPALPTGAAILFR